MAVLQQLVARTDSELGAIGRDLKAVVGQERCLRALLAARNEDLRRAAADRATLEQRLEQVYPSPPHPTSPQTQNASNFSRRCVHACTTAGKRTLLNVATCDVEQ